MSGISVPISCKSFSTPSNHSWFRRMMFLRCQIHQLSIEQKFVDHVLRPPQQLEYFHWSPWLVVEHFVVHLRNLVLDRWTELPTSQHCGMMKHSRVLHESKSSNPSPIRPYPKCTTRNPTQPDRYPSASSWVQVRVLYRFKSSNPSAIRHPFNARAQLDRSLFDPNSTSGRVELQYSTAESSQVSAKSLVIFVALNPFWVKTWWEVDIQHLTFSTY